MIGLKIKEKDGYMVMDDLPHDCIFIKDKTGCGRTSIALNNEENYIVTVPTTELIENKCYPTKDKDGNDQYWEKSQKQPGLSPVKNVFGLYGNQI
ncbi:MAG: hypothetical protein LUH15_20850 [Tannerellaceae bacterium]|nr:hypothetical protein [Tannerellaceae bacterium]